MLLSDFKNQLKTVTEVIFLKPDGTTVPSHFHITEVGEIHKKYIDCGGTIRNEHLISLQLWESIDTWHRLEPNKLISIIDLSIEKLSIGNHNIEVEYQGDTIGKYGIALSNGVFQLVPTQTNCLASDQCGIPPIEKKIEKAQSCCTPNSGCC